ncbi:hypothetical protein VNO80_18254 [Phaseolus coccineus]|uniref:Uncharacterized protein n=1 Tax=Phaseolus coccineus TaxID=3886 RepID=A0AAN9MHB8_PHACN
MIDNFSCSHGFMEGYIFHVMWGFEYFASFFLGEVTLGCFTVELGTHTMFRCLCIFCHCVIFVIRLGTPMSCRFYFLKFLTVKVFPLDVCLLESENFSLAVSAEF